MRILLEYSKKFVEMEQGCRNTKNFIGQRGEHNFQNSKVYALNEDAVIGTS